MCKRDCIYAGQQNIHIGAGEHCCDYVLAMMGTEREQKTRFGTLVKKYKLPPTHRKIRLLMMGENCQFYEPLYPGRKKPRKTSPILPRKPREAKEYTAPADEDRLMALYKEGLSDRNVAETLGLKEFQVLRWRQERDLPSNYSLHRLDKNRARELYEEGKSDREIAEILGVVPNTICQWRKKEKLKAKRQYAKVNYDRLRELYDQGLNDTQIYRITGTSKDAIRKWRKSTGLKANWRTTE